MKNIIITFILIFNLSCEKQEMAAPQQEIISFEYSIDGGGLPSVPSPKLFLSDNSGTIYLNYRHFKGLLNENSKEPTTLDTILLIDDLSRDSLLSILKAQISLNDFSESVGFGYNQDLAYQYREIMVLNTNLKTIYLNSYENKGPENLLYANSILKQYLKDSYVKIFKEK